MFSQQQFSPRPFGSVTMRTHDEHQTLYSGYVKNATSVQEKIAALRGDESKTYELGELYRRFSFEFNGMRNHECYFSLLEGNATALSDGALKNAIIDTWGSIDVWKTEMISLATTRGIGWAMLSFDPSAKKLILHWVDEQHLGQLQGTHPIIALDMWEHSYVADYQPSGKKQYIADFIEAINWSVVEARYEKLVSIDGSFS